jgi:hypothetical protein
MVREAVLVRMQVGHGWASGSFRRLQTRDRDPNRTPRGPRGAIPGSVSWVAILSTRGS